MGEALVILESEGSDGSCRKMCLKDITARHTEIHSSPFAESKQNKIQGEEACNSIQRHILFKNC